MQDLEVLQRKQKIWELTTIGFTQQQIAEKLNVSLKTISRDYAELKTESLEWLDALPKGEIQLEHKKSFETIKMVIQQLWEICRQTKDEMNKVKILDQISKKSETHLKMMGVDSILGLKNRIKKSQRTHLDGTREMHEINLEQRRLSKQDNL